MSREEAIAIIQKEFLCVNKDCNIERNCYNCDLAMPNKEPILEAYDMAIKALQRELELSGLPPVNSTEKIGYWMDNGFCGNYVCSVCKNEFDSDIPNMKGFNFELPKYCPNCGVKISAL